MAQSQLNEENLGKVLTPRDVADNAENRRIDSECLIVSPHDSSAKKTKSRQSKYDTLDSKWTKRFEQSEGKMDKMFNLLQTLVQKDKNDGDLEVQSQRRTNVSKPHAQSQRRRDGVNEYEPQRSCSETSDGPDDYLSLQPGQIERDNLQISSDSESESAPQLVKKTLADIFGDDVFGKKTVTKSGLHIDNSQKDVLNTSYRSKNPHDVSAFAEEYIDLFPVDETTDSFLHVPSIDSLIETCLSKRHGTRSTSKLQHKGKSLVSQPYRMLEKVAYRGQQAAKLGIIMQLYLQQGLGNVLELVRKQEPDLELVTQQIKDIFEISTKSLDQLGRTGAFHHILRRTVAMTDTGLYQLEDSDAFTSLPLTGDGLFGADLQTLMKDRKVKKQQIDDLVPEIKKKDTTIKRTLPVPQTSTKRPRFDNERYSGRNNDTEMNFRIPKFNRDDNRGPKSQGATFDRKRFDSGSYGRGRGRSETTSYSYARGRGRGRRQ